MLTLEKRLTLNLSAVEAPNLTDRFENDDLKRIGAWVKDGYERDQQSRQKWMKRTEAAMDLALQIQKEKSFPWPNCSNIAFPLVTIATLQFHARAYPAIVQGKEIVGCQVWGDDETGKETERAKRISTHMSYQCLEQDKAWEEQHDRLLINLPVVGCAFKKTYYDAGKGHNVSDLVLAKDFVLNYWAKSVETCQRKTHIIPFYRNDIHERAESGTFRDVRDEAWYNQIPQPRTDRTTQLSDNRQGINTPTTDETTPFTVLEQHCNLDLDQDGYAEPYIITVEETSGTVLRIVCGFDRMEDIQRSAAGRIIRISKLEYFTKYSFIPSPDGGVYDIGFGVLLGPLNESVNSIVNQLVDAGTMSVTAGGFLGKGAKIRGGVYTFAPLEWKRVDSSGDDLHKNIVPLEVREPSAVLFQLLTFLISYVNRVSGTTDPMVGENPGQNQPAETTRTVVEMGQKIYSAIFKRIWRSMKDEFEKLYVLNGIYLPERSSFGQGFASRSDYLGDPSRVRPVADPNVTSDQAKVQQALFLKQSAATTPGYNTGAVERKVLKAMQIEGIEEIYPGPEKMPPGKDIKLQIAELKEQGNAAKLKFAQMEFVANMRETMRLNDAEIANIQAEIQARAAELGLKQEELKGDNVDREIGRMNAMVGIMKHQNDTMHQKVEAIIKGMELDLARGELELGHREADIKEKALEKKASEKAAA